MAVLIASRSSLGFTTKAGPIAAINFGESSENCPKDLTRASWTRPFLNQFQKWTAVAPFSENTGIFFWSHSSGRFEPEHSAKKSIAVQHNSPAANASPAAMRREAGSR